VRAALFVHVVQRCISAGLVGHACEDSDQESSGGDERNAESAAISGAHGPYTETVDLLEGPADPAPLLLGKVADVASSKTNPPGRTRTRALAAQV
jgi:hypothetical protein